MPVGSECLYAYYGAGTNSTPTTTPGSSMVVGYPAIPVPAGFMKATGPWSSSLKLQLSGFLTATATIPTFAFSLYSTSATPPAWAATNLLTTASTANTPSSAATFPFYMEWNLGLRTAGAGGANSTIAASGFIESPGLAAPYQLFMPPAGSGNTFATWEPNTQYFLWPTILLSAATAGNYVTTQWCKLYGEGP